MALIECKECKKEISDEAKICPNCGAKTEKSKQDMKKLYKTLRTGLIILAIVICFGIFYINRPLYKYSREAISILNDYKSGKITKEEAWKQIDNLHDVVSSKFDNNHEQKYLSLAIDLNGASISLSTGTTTKIDESIKELKKY